MELFLDAVVQEFLEATNLLRRRANGDYSTDQHLQSLPEYSKAKPLAKGSGRTCFELFEAYVTAVQPRPSTVNRWRVVFTTLDEHLDGRKIDHFSADEAQQWATSLVTERRGARTVSDVWLTAANTVLAWALKQKLITANPFAGVSISVPKKVLKREDGKAFSEKEQRVILKAAREMAGTKSAFKAACRWAPWLCAYSGA